jgi:hypothetical protein
MTSNRKRRHSSSSSSPSLDDDSSLYEELGHHVNSIKKFFVDQHVTRFVLHNASSFPEDDFMDILEKLINRAYSHVRRDQRLVQLFSMILDGQSLDTPIVIPARRRQQNSVDMIMNEVLSN